MSIDPVLFVFLLLPLSLVIHRSEQTILDFSTCDLSSVNLNRVECYLFDTWSQVNRACSLEIREAALTTGKWVHLKPRSPLMLTMEFSLQNLLDVDCCPDMNVYGPDDPGF
jgi:hypothetical protein